MKQTNYHLFDFLDFDINLKQDESLWKAYAPSDIKENNGDVWVTIPFQKQVLANDMQADESAAQETYVLKIRAYSNNSVRLFSSFNDEECSDNDDMLCWHPSVKKIPLRIEKDGDVFSIVGEGGRYAQIDCSKPVLEHWSDLLPEPQSTVDITIYPEGDRTPQGKSVRLSAYDHFSPPRYDALPLALVKRDGKNDAVTVHYTGRLIDGTVFDSSIERGEPATFGVGQVIAGWTEALQMMQEGAAWRLFIPSDLAYGSQGTGPIRPHSTLIFDVQLLKVEKH